MKRAPLFVLAAAALLARSFAADPVEVLNPTEVQQALTLLKSNFVHPEALSDPELARATLRGLLARLSPSVTLLPAPAGKTPPSPFRSEILGAAVGYLRLGDLSKAALEELDGVLKNLREKSIKAAVLDLRATPASNDYESAAEVIKRFCAKGKLLFTIGKSGTKPARIFTSNVDPAFHGVLAVLVDADGAAAVEVIAAALRAQAGALLVGEKTSGQAMEFTDLPLHGGATLRVAVAEVAMSDNTSISPDGVKPDLAVAMAGTTKREVLRAALDRGVAPLVTDSERPRMNEAALVAGTNPEIDAAEAAQNDQGKTAPVLSDTPLQRALDLITTIRVYDKARADK